MKKAKIQNNSASQNTVVGQSGPTVAHPIRIWIGADWADQKHCLVVQPLEGPAQTHFLEQKPELLDQFFLRLRQQHPQGLIGICLEQSRGALLYALMKYDFLVIYPVNPRSLADFRRAFCVSGAKSDPSDAQLLCEMGLKHQPRLRPLQVEDPATRKRRLLVEGRRGFVDQHTAFLNQQRAVLKCYYPLLIELFEENLESDMAREFLRRWPNLAALQRAKPAVLRAFFYRHNSRSEEKIRQRLQAIQSAVPLTEDEAIIQPLQLQALGLAEQLAGLSTLIKQYDEQIHGVFQNHSEAWLFSELPGAGPVLAPRLAALFGTARENWPSALDLLCRTGVAPVKKQSGKQLIVLFRWARPKFIHQTLVEFAKCSLKHCAWAKLLFEDQRAKGKSPFGALRIVAFKWVRILWRCWQDRVAYDEFRYLRGLQKRNVKLYASLYQSLTPENVNNP